MTLTTPANKSVLIKFILFGALVGLAIISLFIFPVRNPDPAWGEFWKIRPLIVVTLAGAAGGACAYYINHFRSAVGIGKVLAVLISIIVCLVGLWIGIVLGLNGTLWN